MRVLFVIHRYLGIAVGLLMLIWCLSGMVMMYVPYPQLTELSRQQHLPRMDWRSCCTLHSAAISGDMPIDTVQLEMLGTTPVLRWRNASHHLQTIDAATGAAVTRISEAQAFNVAQPYGKPGVKLPLLDLIDHDQWTVQGAGGEDRPLFHFSLGDAAGTELYISRVTGKAIQITTSRERFWNWLGAVPHWIYFSKLRQHPELWSSVLVWASITGSFLTVTGLYIGIRQFRRRALGTWVPYHGVQYWHHVLGLVFGLFVLMWVTSGLISMNPWGFLEAEPPSPDAARLRGPRPVLAELEASLAAFAATPEAREAVSIETAPLNGQLFLIAVDSSGTRLRADARGHHSLLSAPEFDYITTQIAREYPVLSRQALTSEDEYYFTHHSDHAQLPVYRIILNDADRTRYYIDSVTGEISVVIDRDARWYRWLHQAMHRLDFCTAFRASKARDLVLLILLIGMTAVCGIGTYLGVRRVLRYPHGV